MTTPLWYSGTSLFQAPPLRANASADVCIVGGGIAGLTTAYTLLKAGASVILIDRAQPAGGETGRTSAHLANALDDRFYELEKMHGLEGARLAAQSHGEAISYIEKIVSDEGLNCEFERVDGYLFAAPGSDPTELDRELEAAHRAGLKGVQRLARAPLPSFDTGPCLRFPDQAQFHPVRYLTQLAQKVQQRGGRLYGKTRAVEFLAGQVRTEQGFTIKASHIVVASHVPVNDWVRIHTKQAAHRSYVIVGTIPRGLVPRALYWDTADPYHYIRTQALPGTPFDLLLVGGEDHKVGQERQPDVCYNALESWTRQRFPQMETVLSAWSGQIIEPADSLAFIGRNPGGPENVYIVTGDSGNGLTHGTLAALLLNDLIHKRANPWEKLYDPSRAMLKADAAKHWVKENANAVSQMRDWLNPGEDLPLKPGDGAIVRQGAKKVAVFRDPSNQLRSFSAVCPHMGCFVRWNPAESSFDCPCHGSRFDTHGRVLNGPSPKDLEPVALEKSLESQA